ncbi:hypothetical protein EK904_005433 [Melospiza melodia maxima]|nr:hypothetical protein EK904_005433 [Melospiza melodia maxima]
MQRPKRGLPDSEVAGRRWEREFCGLHVLKASYGLKQSVKTQDLYLFKKKNKNKPRFGTEGWIVWAMLGLSISVLPTLQPCGEMLRMSGYSGRAVPSFTLHSFLQRAVARDLEGTQSSQARQLCTAGAHSITQSCGVVTSQQGTALQGRRIVCSDLNIYLPFTVSAAMFACLKRLVSKLLSFTTNNLTPSPEASLQVLLLRSRTGQEPSLPFALCANREEGWVLCPPRSQKVQVLLRLSRCHRHVDSKTPLVSGLSQHLMAHCTGTLEMGHAEVLCRQGPLHTLGNISELPSSALVHARKDKGPARTSKSLHPSKTAVPASVLLCAVGTAGNRELSGHRYTDVPTPVTCMKAGCAQVLLLLSFHFTFPKFQPDVFKSLLIFPLPSKNDKAEGEIRILECSLPPESR